MSLLALMLAASVAQAGSVTLEARENANLDQDLALPPVVFSVSGLGDAAAWQVQVYDSRNKKVSYVQGRSGPPSEVAWYGLSPDGGLLPNGFYTARLVWRDEAGKIHQSQATSTSLLSLQEMGGFLGPQVSLDQNTRGLIIRIKEGLVFAPGEWDLRPESLPIVDRIASFLRAHSSNRLVVQGFSDSLGSADFNHELSLRRAGAVFDRLAQNGIDASRVTYEGRGAAEPLASNATAEGRAKNRRVEILVLKAQG